MSLELNRTYKCTNPNHPKTARRNKYEPAPICPICRQPMEQVFIPHKARKKKKKYAVNFD